MKLKKFDSINVIPFIDVLLVLLAIVLMTSTFIAKGVIPISLPTAKSSTDMKMKDDMKIVIKADNTIYLDKMHISLEALRASVETIDTKTPILINSDKNAKFDVFVQILDMLKINQFENISIVTKK